MSNMAHAHRVINIEKHAFLGLVQSGYYIENFWGVLFSNDMS